MNTVGCPKKQPNLRPHFSPAIFLPNSCGDPRISRYRLFELATQMETVETPVVLRRVRLNTACRWI